MLNRKKQGDKHVATHTHTHSKKRDGPTIILTGDRKKRRHVVWVADSAVWLQGKEFALLCDLVVARATTTTGLMAASRVDAHRLKHELNHAVPDGDKDQFIVTGSGEEFRLAIDHRDVGFDPSFRELEARGFITDDTFKAILKHCGEVKQV